MRSLVLVLALVACKSDKPAPQAQAAPPAPAPVPAPAPAPPPAAPAATGSAAVATLARDCTAATDCIVVKTATCDPCGCPDQAIASKAMAVFDEAQAKLACPPPDLTKKCAPCAAKVAACEAGTCVAKPRT
jgi:2-oxoglutarate dehydrogenase E2 component (dihydrolipoamide succinyltransferase)